MTIRRALPIALMLLAAAPASAQTGLISIQCSGVNKASDGNCVFGQNSQMSCWETPNNSNETVFVVIDQGSGRVQIPATLYKTKGDGWMDIEELEVGEQFITGRLNFSSFTKPRLKIDRFAGSIDISSSSLVGTSFKFSASCQKAELNKQRF